MSPVNDAYHKDGLASSADRIAMSQVASKDQQQGMMHVHALSWLAPKSQVLNPLKAIMSIAKALDKIQEQKERSKNEYHSDRNAYRQSRTYK